ncbi:hypothetical protein ANN_25881 [Periplaneta americana]|uniref:Uncharacterized protein n=1 Tax=Periplaneta americana TaxID=6978 RepID=A0ABQ8S4L6_PERAM|nr:hypothetical protein ANN_25881 [Periplaneta americana]
MRILKKSNRKSKELEYKTLVRPVMEYGAVGWDPDSQNQIDSIEKVQRKAAKYVKMGKGHGEEIVKDLGWELLKSRRRKPDSPHCLRCTCIRERHCDNMPLADQRQIQMERSLTPVSERVGVVEGRKQEKCTAIIASHNVLDVGAPSDGADDNVLDMENDEDEPMGDDVLIVEVERLGRHYGADTAKNGARQVPVGHVRLHPAASDQLQALPAKYGIIELSDDVQPSRAT